MEKCVDHYARREAGDSPHPSSDETEVSDKDGRNGNGAMSTERRVLLRRPVQVGIKWEYISRNF